MMCFFSPNSDGQTVVKIATNQSRLSLDYTIEIIPILSYIGVVFPFVGSIPLGCYHLDFVMSSKKNANIFITIKPDSTFF